MTDVPVTVSKSAIEGVAWPALPGRDGMIMLAVLQQLEYSQWWPEQALTTFQMHQLHALLSHAAATVPFYRDRLTQAGFDPSSALTPELWRDIPILSRDEVQRAGTRLHSESVPEAHGKVHKVTTSGSTGKPIQALGTHLSNVYWKAFTVREILWHCRDLNARHATVRHIKSGGARYPDGATQKFWGPEVTPVFRTGPSAFLDISSTNAAEQADWLVRQNPDYLLIYPSALVQLARHCIANGIRFPKLREARTVSEIVHPEVRAAAREAWDVKVVDMYSANEIGYMALQCPIHDHYHLQSESCMVEVLGAHGRPCQPGEVGRVVVTPLHNFASPLIRYDILDLAEVGPPCSCGRGLPVINRIIGRVRNMLMLPEGGRLPSSTALLACIGDRPVKQFQFVQTALDTLDAKLVVERPLSEAEEAGIKDDVRRHLGFPFKLTFQYVDHIPRGPSGKFEDFRCEVPNS